MHAKAIAADDEEDLMTETTTLEQAQRLVNQLPPHEQVRLLAYLAERLAQVVPTQPSATSTPEAAEAWETFFQLGERLAATDSPERETLTAAVLAMRR
jgi:hypothetical protein